MLTTGWIRGLVREVGDLFAWSWASPERARPQTRSSTPPRGMRLPQFDEALPEAVVATDAPTSRVLETFAAIRGLRRRGAERKRESEQSALRTLIRHRQSRGD